MTDDNKLAKLSITVLAAGAVAFGSYVLFRKFYGRSLRGLRLEDITEAEMEQLLDEVQKSQGEMKKMMNIFLSKSNCPPDDLKVVIQDSTLSFEQICILVDQMRPADPLAVHGVSLEEFSQLLAHFNGSDRIRNKILKLTAGPYTEQGAGKISQKQLDELNAQYSDEDVVAMHSFMLGQLKKVLESIGSDVHISARVATISAQAYIAAMLEKQWPVTSDQLEALTSAKQERIGARDDFFEIGAEMRQVVQMLVEKCSEGGGQKTGKMGENKSQGA